MPALARGGGEEQEPVPQRGGRRRPLLDRCGRAHARGGQDRRQQDRRRELGQQHHLAGEGDEGHKKQQRGRQQDVSPAGEGQGQGQQRRHQEEGMQGSGGRGGSPHRQEEASQKDGHQISGIRVRIREDGRQPDAVRIGDDQAVLLHKAVPCKQAVDHHGIASKHNSVPEKTVHRFLPRQEQAENEESCGHHLGIPGLIVHIRGDGACTRQQAGNQIDERSAPYQQEGRILPPPSSLLEEQQQRSGAQREIHKDIAAEQRAVKSQALLRLMFIAGVQKQGASIRRRGQK
ncbi:hypothetical protein PM3016_6162 [Paenibacillus mucilaginosus 3016]|uniref:Uncharacterized protein n=1 Tax=Paenibacillus mucilaginosus 3016 TaxID=1116391 RepID=H6NRR7_9BACL|nr:hypothetical protein PM3016_6162 [Paenibacillus mucilaginosus 3016]